MEIKERLEGILVASRDKLELVDAVLNGETLSRKQEKEPDSLLTLQNAAEKLAISRTSLWRLCKSGKLERVEILPGTFRIRRSDIDALVMGSTQEVA